MAVVNTMIAEQSNQDLSFETAGFMSIFNAVFTLAMGVTHIFAMSKRSAGLLFFIEVPLSFVSCFMTIFVSAFL